jgi:hypothetical protein
MKNKKEKKFDAVKMMRTIRDKVTKDTADMSFDELKVYLQKKLRKSDLKILPMNK